MLKIGYTRVNFNYFSSDREIDYILDAIEFVAAYGWMLLPDYTFDLSGAWTNRSAEGTITES